jgi:uncharacterized protein YndB with AHSA1/START domain
MRFKVGAGRCCVKVVVESDYPVTDEACKAATGRTIQDWFAEIDSLGGPSVGRKGVNDHLYGNLKVDMWWVATINNLYEAHKGVIEKDGRGKGFNICVTKTISAPLDKVYEAWTDPAALSKWFGANTQATVADGGTYTNDDGDTGAFKRVRRGKDLRFTWENPAHQPSMVDVTFTDKGNGKTYLLVNLDRVQTRSEADGLRHGWGSAVDKLKTLLES